MSVTFRYEQFEELTGHPLGAYAWQIWKGGNVPSDFIDYFRANTARWDGQHLEAGLLILRQLDTDTARHLIADHLNHPLQHIRFTVYGMLDAMEPIDPYVMSRIDDFWRSPERRREFVAEEVDRFRASAMKRLVG